MRAGRATVVRSPARSALLLTGLGLLSGCAVGPNYHRPTTVAPAQWVSDDRAAVGVDGKEPQSQWWRQWHSEAVDAAIAEALQRSPTIALAEANLKAAHALDQQVLGSFLPEVGVSGQTSRNRDAVTVLSPALSSGEAVYGLRSGQLNVGLVMDVFGANRRAYEAAKANTESQQWQLDAARLMVSANVAVTLVNESAWAQSSAAWDQVQRDGQAMLEIQQYAWSQGAISKVEFAQEQTNFAQVKAQAAAVKQKWRLLQDQRAVYLGQMPNEPRASIALESIQPLASIPMGLPSDLIVRRPDVRAAEAQLHAATAGVGVAIGNLLPQVTLNGTLGSVSTSSLFKSNSGFWSGNVQLSQSLFAGGALWQKVVGARAAVDAAGAQYRLVVLTAFQNTNDALWVLATDYDAYQAATLAADAAWNVKTVTEQKCQLGEASRYQCLQADSQYQQAKAAEWQAKATWLSDQALLSVAVAGPIPSTP